MKVGVCESGEYCGSYWPEDETERMLPPPGGDVEPVDAGASGSMPVCTASNWLDKTAPPDVATQRPREGTQERQSKSKTKLLALAPWSPKSHFACKRKDPHGTE